MIRFRAAGLAAFLQHSLLFRLAPATLLGFDPLNVNQTLMNMSLDTARKGIKITAKSYGWDDWFKIKEDVEPVNNKRRGWALVLRIPTCRFGARRNRFFFQSFSSFSMPD
jgi:hypothetical protein